MEIWTLIEIEFFMHIWVSERESELVKVISGAINYAIIDSKGFMTSEKMHIYVYTYLHIDTHTHVHSYNHI